MDAELKTKWVKALRSGKFKQGTGKLYRNGAHCCLGVLAAIQGCKLVSAEYDVYSADGRRLKQPANGYLPTSVAAGLNAKVQHELAMMNDDGNSFRKIADHIKANL